MQIININSQEQLYSIITRNAKCILFFYTIWCADCSNYENAFIQESRKYNNYGIVFCKINCDLLPVIQFFFDINIRKLPATLFIYNNSIFSAVYGNRPLSLENHCIELANL